MEHIFGVVGKINGVEPEMKESAIFNGVVDTKLGSSNSVVKRKIFSWTATGEKVKASRDGDESLVGCGFCGVGKRKKEVDKLKEGRLVFVRGAVTGEASLFEKVEVVDFISGEDKRGEFNLLFFGESETV